MGVKGLYTYLRPYRHDIYPQTLPSAPKLRIGFDAMSMLYKYKSSFQEMLLVLKDLQDAGHFLLFVFDGKPPPEKAEEVRERREARNDAAAQAAALRAHLAADTTTTGRERQILEYSAARLEFQGWHVTREVRHSFQDQLRAADIEQVKASGEADDVLIDLVGAGMLDVVVSSDMDFLLAGVQRLWIPFRKAGDGFEEILLEEVLAGEGLTAEEVRDAGILCGVEGFRGRVSIPTQTAFSWMRYYKSLDAILASSIQDPQLQALREAKDEIPAVRAHFLPQLPWSARIHPDHLERVKPILEFL